MRAKGLVKSRRLIWFGIPFLCLSFLLYRRSARVMFWTQRRDRHAEALEFSGSDVDVKLVEQITPTTIRLLVFVPPGRRVDILPVTGTSEKRERAPVSTMRIETFDKPGRVQITYNLYWDDGSSPGLLYGSWLKLSGATVTPDIDRHVVGIPEEASGWKIAPGMNQGLMVDSESEYFLPVFVNDDGYRIGLEFSDKTEVQ